MKIKVQKKDLYLLLILLIISIIIYAPSFNGPLFFDDVDFVEKNEYVHKLNLMPELFTKNIFSDSFFYRPLQFATYSLIYQLFNTAPFPYHFVSLLFHFGCVVLLFYLLKDLKFNKYICFFASLLFLVHPVNTQAVSYISGLGEPLGLFFILLALLIYRKDKFFKNKTLKYTLFTLSIILAILAKERSAIFIALFFIFDISFPKEDQDKKTRYIFYIIPAVITLMYFLFRRFFLELSFPIAGDIYSTNIIVRFYTFLYAFWEYLVAIFFPMNLYSEHTFLVFQDIFSFRQIIALIIIISLIIISICRFKKHKVLFFSFFWFMFALLPSSGIIPIAYSMKEHWIYYSMIGFTIGFTYYFFKIIKNKKIAATLFIIICILLSMRTFSRNIEWSDPDIFWKNELKNNPQSENAILEIAAKYYHEGDIDKAISLYEYGIKVMTSSRLSQVYINLAYIYQTKGNINKSITLYEKGLEIDPYHEYALNQLSQYYYKKDTEKFNLYNSRLKEIK